MIEVNTVDLGDLGVDLPGDRVAVVFSQPYLRLTGGEPYVTTPSSIEGQLAAISRTLEVAKSRPHHLDRTHLTVFPEYSIPGLSGARALLEELSDDSWPSATIVVGGLDGLTKAEYERLCNLPGAHCSNSNDPATVPDDEWINCSLTIIKDNQGQLQFWIQPKVWPSWEEQNIRNDRMFRGRTINLFKGRLSNGPYFRFVSLICFDWIATVDLKAPMDWVVGNLDENAGEALLPLTWALIIQNNPKPSHQAFLGRVAPFFDQQRFPRALRANTSLLFCNSAGQKQPHKINEYGGASVIHSRGDLFKPSHNALTVSRGGARFREGSDVLKAFDDTYFRERGACIHAFTLNSSTMLPAGPQGRTFAVEDARVFAFEETCARAPNGPVAASTKWLHDFLDDVQSIGVSFPDAPLAGIVDAAHSRAVAHLRKLDSKATCRLLEVANGTRPENGADDWASAEERAVEHVTNTLDIMIAASPSMTIDPSEMHGAIKLGEVTVDILALSGKRHEHCLDRASWALGSSQRSVLVITRDDQNTPFDPRHGSFLDQPHTGEDRFTFPSDYRSHVGFQDLLTAFRKATGQPGLFEWVQGVLQ